MRTLIVDDHADVRFLIRTIVADAGVGVEVVGEADGVEAALEQLDALAAASFLQAFLDGKLAAHDV